MPLQRGDIYRALVPLPDPAANGQLAMFRKRVVALQDEATLPPAVDYTYLIYSTYQGRALRAFDVLVPHPTPGLPAPDFDRDGVIDCRWVRTGPKSGMQTRLGRLPGTVMDTIDVALIVGLSIQRRP